MVPGGTSHQLYIMNNTFTDTNQDASGREVNYEEETVYQSKEQVLYQPPFANTDYMNQYAPSASGEASGASPFYQTRYHHHVGPHTGFSARTNDTAGSLYRKGTKPAGSHPSTEIHSA